MAGKVSSMDAVAAVRQMRHAPKQLMDAPDAYEMGDPASWHYVNMHLLHTLIMIAERQHVTVSVGVTKKGTALSLSLWGGGDKRKRWYADSATDMDELLERLTAGYDAVTGAQSTPDGEGGD